MTDFTRNRILNANRNDGDGSIYSLIMSHDAQAAPNDGTHYYDNVFRDPENQAFPYAPQQPITLHLSSHRFDVDEFENSFIHLKGTYTFNFTGYPTLSGTSDIEEAIYKNQFVFVGLKASSHIIRDYRIFFNNVEISTAHQAGAIEENFLYSTFKSKGQLNNKRWRYTDYKEVQNMDNSYCGAYISLYEIAQNSGTVSKDIDIIIKYDDLLCFETFDVYPTSIFGQLKFMFIPDVLGFVWCQVNPMNSIKAAVEDGGISTSLSGISEVLSIPDSQFKFMRSFEQQGVAAPVQFITAINASTYAPTLSSAGNMTCTLTTFAITKARTIIKGFNMLDSVKARLRSNFMNGSVFTIVGQQCITQGFNQIPSQTELYATRNAVMNHTTDIEILHPMTTAHYTVFRNIMAQNYQVRVGQRNFPNQNTLNTVGPEFHEMMIDASDFDSIFESNDSYEHSLSDELTDGTRWISSRTDNTSFVPIFRLERDSNGNDVWFDGVNNHSIDVEIKCNPMYTNYNPYSATATTDNTSASPYGDVSCGPKLITTNELYIIFSLLPDGKPNVQFVINYTYDEARQNKMLDAYAVANVYYA